MASSINIQYETTKVFERLFICFLIVLLVDLIYVHVSKYVPKDRARRKTNIFFFFNDAKGVGDENDPFPICHPSCKCVRRWQPRSLA